jgi:hypothetical protein
MLLREIRHIGWDEVGYKLSHNTDVKKGLDRIKILKRRRLEMLNHWNEPNIPHLQGSRLRDAPS